MTYATITFSNPEPGLGLIKLNRPERLNAISLEMLDDLHRLFDKIREDEAMRVLIVTGAGRGFCAGADLMDKAMHDKAAELFSSAAAHLIRVQKRFSRVILEMRDLPQPLISAVNGHAAGGGMCIALASDILIAGPNAKFTPSFANIGLSGGELGTSYFLPRTVGRVRAGEILLTGRTVDAEEAERIGLVNRLVADDQLMDTALATARSLLQKSVFGLRMTKEALNHNLHATDLASAIELENRNQSIACLNPEFFEAISKFQEKK
jgi:enoyl-CoA hydratase